jgi:hypothetical protein
MPEDGKNCYLCILYRIRNKAVLLECAAKKTLEFQLFLYLWTGFSFNQQQIKSMFLQH